MGSEAPYAGLSALFWAGLLTAARSRRRELAEPTSTGDLLALGLAAAKLGDVVAEDRVTVFLRRPFAAELRVPDRTLAIEVAKR